jgi:monomeric isocitrate dehydrogenase
MGQLRLPGGAVYNVTIGGASPADMQEVAKERKANWDRLMKAAYHDRMANTVQDRNLARYHREVAKELRQA